MRWAGALGPIGVGAGMAGAIVASRSAHRGVADGLLSELGASSSPGHVPYRLGQAAAALGALAVAAALGRARVAALPLAAASSLVVLATAVPCSTGCPLPLLDPAPLQDWVHFGAAGAAFCLWPVATWETGRQGPLAAPSRWVTVLLVVLLAVLGPLALVDPHGAPVALAQRALVAVALVWVAAVGMAAIRKP